MRIVGPALRAERGSARAREKNIEGRTHASSNRKLYLCSNSSARSSNSESSESFAPGSATTSSASASLPEATSTTLTFFSFFSFLTFFSFVGAAFEPDAEAEGGGEPVISLYEGIRDLLPLRSIQPRLRM